MINLSNRLSAVVDLVEKGSVVADIGTDHGYIPVFLVENGISQKVIATDVNEMPLASCRDFVKKKGLDALIETRLSDGFEELDAKEFDTAIIAGMGGELIAEILSKFSGLNKVHLVLQPMTHQEIVRKFLYDNGFSIKHDIIVNDSKHYYNVFDAVYTGDFSKKSITDYFLGSITDFSKKEYFVHLLNYLKNKEKSGNDFSDVIFALEEKL